MSDGFSGRKGNVVTNQIRNLIFDIDGTLLDSKRDIAAAQHYVLTQFGIHTYTPEDLYKNIGRPMYETFSAILPPHLHHRIEEAGLIYREYYRPRALETTIPFPGVKETLDEFNRLGVKMAIATTKSTETSIRVLGHFGLKDYFVQIQGTYPHQPYKPDPFIINEILRDQNWEKADTMMIGDTDVDIMAGKNAGIRTCAVTYGCGVLEKIKQLSPDWMVDQFQELLMIVPFAR